MALQIVDCPTSDYRNARYFAKACDLAYLNEAQGVPLYKTELGLEASLISVSNTQVYLGHDDKNLVVIFRGSESPASFDGLKDWLLTNANNFLILPEGEIGTDFAAAGVGARFHRGFMDALADIWEPLFAAIDAAQSENERLLWVTGHSLGGALALLAAWRLQRRFLTVHQVYTYGSPMIGNAAAAEAFQREFKGRIFRYVDCLDLVPLLPRVSLVANEYLHCLQEYELGKTGGEESKPAADMLHGMASATVDGLLHATIMDEIWGQLMRRISSHMMPNYEARIAEMCPESP